MESNDPPGPEPPTGESEFGQDALRRLEQRLDRASDAAERLIAEAASHATHKPPPAGWQTPAGDGKGGGADGRGAGDFELLSQTLQAVRDLIPPELQRRLAEALRELLLALRALIDWYLERSQRRRPEPAEVQDIPIL